MRYDPQLISCRANDTTSTDVASHFYLLEYHRKRLHEAAQFFDAQTSLHLPKLDYLEDSGSFRTLLYDRIAEYAKVEQPQSSDEKGICNAKLQSVHGYKDNQEVLLPTIPLRVSKAAKLREMSAAVALEHQFTISIRASLLFLSGQSY